MKLNRKWLLAIALVLSMTMAIGGTLAYLTDRDTVENTFTMGNVDIEVEEVFPDGNIKPGETVNKDAKITNEGSNPAWVWMTVSVPEGLKDYVTMNWADGFAPTSNSPVVENGQAVWTVLVEDQLPAGEETDYILTSVTLSGYVDYQGGKYVVVQNGEVTDLEGIVNGQMVVTVTGYATQVDGLSTVAAAYSAYQGQWGEEVAPVEDPRVRYNGTVYDDIYKAVAAANENGGGTIELLGSAKLHEPLEISANITIEGNGHQFSRADGFTGTMFTVKTGATLTMDAVILDGIGANTTGNLIATEGTGSIILNEGTVLKNNVGAHAGNLATRGGGTLTRNGAEISNNSSDSGAIWGGGHITINEGSKINNNASTGSAGAIRMVGKCNLTMNGGEICGNTAAKDGGAIWGYGINGNTSVYNLNGGKISGNTAGGVGGGIYTGNYSTINISGDFEMCNNAAAESGAMRLADHTTFNMTGGKISGNVSTNNAAWSGFYSWNPAVNISGGELADNITIQGGLQPIVGGDGIAGIVYFALSTNHNTAHLASGFGTIKFHVSEGDNFAAFNLKPAADYTYAAGDEAKLICMNEGYSTYWDAGTGTFKIKAD